MRNIFVIWFSFLTAIRVCSQVYPPPSSISYCDGILTICPPDSVPWYSGGLIGYNVFLDGGFVTNIPSVSPEDTVEMTFNPPPLPGFRTFCATANYVNWISDQVCDTAFVQYGFALPFEEDWSSGSFETNGWIPEDDDWTIDTGSGEPLPSATFNASDGMNDYFVTLTSCGLMADTIPLQYVLIEFSVKLESVNNSGNEKLNVQYWRWSNQTWNTIDCGGLTNQEGSFEWRTIHCKFSPLQSGPFLMRFVASGVNSSDISAWHIDNIHIFQDCGSVSELTSTVEDPGKVVLEWQLESDCWDCWWCWLVSYHMSGSYGNSIGTGSEAVFDVAARWSSEKLQDYEGEYITAVRFFPAESQATYSIRIWEGDSAVLVYEQAVSGPVISAWNEVCLNTIHPIDITKDLWIGYHIEAQFGYPAGTDWGPAIDGEGNMIYWDGQWSTMLEISPDLVYNWLIEAFPSQHYPKYCDNRIYKKVGEGEYNLIDIISADEWNAIYVDYNADLSQSNCYKITNYSRQNADTCESVHYSESCVLPVIIQENKTEPDLLIYPNPTSGMLYINYSSEIYEVQIIDNTGRVVMIERNLSSPTSIQVHDLSPGIYIMKIALKDDFIYRKILIS